MARSVFIAMFFAVALFAASAVAGEIEAKVQSFNATERTITLENGTKLWLAEGVDSADIKEGADIRVSFEERDGRSIATRIEAK